MEFRVDASAARNSWPLAVGLSFFISACGSWSSDDEPEPLPTDKATSALCAKLGTGIVDAHMADLTMLAPADRAAQRAAAEASFGPTFMKTCTTMYTVAQVRCALAANGTAEISACVSSSVVAPVSK